MSDIQRTYKVLITTELYDSAESIDNPIGEIAQDQVVEVIEPNLGNYFQFSKVEYGGLEYFLRSCFLAPEEGTPSTFEVTGFKEVYSELEEIKIKDAKLAIPYIERGKVNVVLDCGTVLKSELEARLADLKLQAFECIFEYYGKVYTEAQANEFSLNPFGLIEVSEPHFPARPGFNILVKFSIKMPHIDAFADLSFEQFSIDNIHKNYIAVSVNLSSMEATVRDVVKTLETYDKRVSKFDGQLIGVNYKSLSVRMRKFLSEFKKFLTINNVVDYGSSADATVELGFNILTFRLEYVLYFASPGRFLRIGMPPLAGIIDRRLAKLLISHRDILSAAQSGIDWQQFSKDYFSGEYKIIFTPPALQAPNLRLPTSQIKTNLDKLTADFNDLSFMDVDQNMGLSSLKLDPKFKTSASELLLRSRDMIGDNFLIDLPDILENVEDLNSLYGLVFDKVSVKDLVDIMMEQMAASLNIPDINEIKLRGIMKALSPDIAIDLISQFATDEFKLSKLGLSICDVYNIGKEQIDDLLSNFQIPIVPIELYFIHYNADGELAGMLAERFQGDLTAVLEENGINDCAGLIQSLAQGNFKISDYFQEQAIGEVICQILSEGLPKFENPCSELGFPAPNGLGISSIPRLTLSDLRLDILDVFKGIKPSILIKGIDGFAKGAFADAKNYQIQLDIQSSGGTPDFSGIDFQISPGELFGEFTKIPKIKIELDKINLTKKKMLNKAPNLDIDLEFRKKDVSFNLPSKKSVNPSFDFSAFQFGSIGDIFGGAVTSIEDGIKDGIEKGLVAAFKGILMNVLDSINMNAPNVDFPDFGGLNMNDLLDASDGASANRIAELALGSIDLEISKFKFDPDLKGCSVQSDITDYSPDREDVKKAFDDISKSMKPMELTRAMKGLRNSRDFVNMSQAITDPMMKEAFTEDVFNEVMDIVTDYVDVDMLEALEKAYDDKEVMVSVCNDRGVPYNLRGIKDSLADKYADLSSDELDNLIDSIVDETKNSLIDAIGSLKNNFTDNLPFDEDPCSFMPKQSDIPAMDFVNDITFNTIFDPIELEYKSEATSFPDLMMQTSPSDEYVKLRLFSLDVMVDSVEQNAETGLYKINYVYVKDKFPDIDDEEGIYNQDFGNNYFGSQTTLYFKDANGQFHPSSVSKVKKDDTLDEWKFDTVSPSAVDGNIYVRKQDEKMSPMPELKESLANPNIAISPPSTGLFTDLSKKGYQIQFRSLMKRDKLVTPTYQRSSTDFVAEADPRFAGNNIFTSPRVVFDDGGNNVTLVTPNPEFFVSQECESDPKEITRDRDVSYVDSVKLAINYMSQRLLGINATSFFYTAINGTEYISTGNYLEKRDLVANITLETAKLMSKTFSTAPLFKQEEMLSFLFDTEDVNLLKAQDAKKSAKDEFNEECDFTDDNSSKLKSSSIKKLIELTIRVYIIDTTIKACFANSIAYEEEASDYFIDQLYEAMSTELELQKNSYFSLFKSEYKKEFGEDLRADSSKFREMVKNIYADVASNFETIFPIADKNILRHALKNVEFFTGTTQHKFLDKLNQMFGASKVDSSAPRLILKSVVREEGEEVFYNPARHSSDSTTIVHRLCLVMEVEANKSTDPFRQYVREVGTSSENPLDTRYRIEATNYPYTSTPQAGWQFSDFSYETNFYVSDETGLGDRYSSSDTTLSYVYSVYRKVDSGFDSTSEQHLGSYLCLPLAESSPVLTRAAVDFTDTPSRIEKVIDHIIDQPAETGNINDLFMNVLAAPAYLEVLRNSLVIKMHQIKPETVQAFSSTKDSIRRAIEALAQDKDNFDHDESETTDNQLEQSQGQSTNPEFSNKAGKMALMTIPMIIKGAAEMFDPNTKIASLIRQGANLSGLDIPPPVASLMGLPFNIIPFAPGPPITPLGLLYLATSFLEPKERKKLSDLKRGKNLNPGADPETGGFAGGTLEEAIEQLERIAEITKERTVGFYDEMAAFTIDFAQNLNNAVTDMYELYYDEIDMDLEGTKHIYVPFDFNGSIPAPPFNDYFKVSEDTSGFFPVSEGYNDSPNVNIGNLQYAEGHYVVNGITRDGIFESIQSMWNECMNMPRNASVENYAEVTQSYEKLSIALEEVFQAFRNIFHEDSHFRLGHYTWLKFFDENMNRYRTQGSSQSYEALLASTYRDARKFYRLYTRLFYTAAYSFFYYGYGVARIMNEHDILPALALNGSDFEPQQSAYISNNTIKNDYEAYGSDWEQVLARATTRWFNMFGDHIANREGEVTQSLPDEVATIAVSQGLIDDIEDLRSATRIFVEASEQIDNFLTIQESPTKSSQLGAQGLNDRFKQFKDMDILQQITDIIKEQFG